MPLRSQIARLRGFITCTSRACLFSSFSERPTLIHVTKTAPSKLRKKELQDLGDRKISAYQQRLLSRLFCATQYPAIIPIPKFRQPTLIWVIEEDFIKGGRSWWLGKKDSLRVGPTEYILFSCPKNLTLAPSLYFAFGNEPNQSRI